MNRSLVFALAGRALLPAIFCPVAVMTVAQGLQLYSH